MLLIPAPFPTSSLKFGWSLTHTPCKCCHLFICSFSVSLGILHILNPSRDLWGALLATTFIYCCSLFLLLNLWCVPIQAKVPEEFQMREHAGGPWEIQDHPPLCVCQLFKGLGCLRHFSLLLIHSALQLFPLRSLWLR